MTREPLLIKAPTTDLNAPPSVALRIADRAAAEVKTYGCDHFDVLPGRAWHDAVVEDPIAFLWRIFREPAGPP